MKYTITSLLFFIVFASFSQTRPGDKTQVETTTTVYYLIRHAEKNRSDLSNKNPDLNTAGIARAYKWASVFKNISFDAIYSTSYKRTQQTATPTAEQKNLTIKEYNPSVLFSEEFKEETLGKTILVVGHSNTTPAFVNAILGEEKYGQINDSNNSNLYIITLVGNKQSVQLLVID